MSGRGTTEERQRKLAAAIAEDLGADEACPTELSREQRAAIVGAFRDLVLGDLLGGEP